MARDSLSKYVKGSSSKKKTVPQELTVCKMESHSASCLALEELVPRETILLLL